MFIIHELCTYLRVTQSIILLFPKRLDYVQLTYSLCTKTFDVSTCRYDTYTHAYNSNNNITPPAIPIRYTHTRLIFQLNRVINF